MFQVIDRHSGDEVRYQHERFAINLDCRLLQVPRNLRRTQ